MKYFLLRTRETLGGATALLLAAFVLAFGLPALAGPRANLGGGDDASSGGESTSQRDGADLSASDDELVGTLPIFDPESGMPIPGEDGEGDDESDDDDEHDGGTPPNPGGGGLLTPPLPPVVGAPKLYLYGPYHLLGPSQAALNGVSVSVHHDPVNAGYAFLVVDESTDLMLPETLFTIDGIETGLLIGIDETSPVVGTVGYLGHFSRPFPMPRGSKKVFPVAALAEYGFLTHSISLHTRSTQNGRAILRVKGSSGTVTLSLMQF